MSLRSIAGMAVAFVIAFTTAATAAPSASAGIVSPIADVCFTEHTGDTTTDFSSPDAKALRDAVAAVAPGGTVKVAGTCAGAVLGGGTTQVALVTKAITLIGGFVPSDWTTSYPLTQPTILDGQLGGRVLFFSGADANVANLVVQNGSEASTHGGGIYASGALSMNNVSVISSTAQFAGGGAFAMDAVTVTGGLFQNNRAVTYDGGGLYGSSSVTLAGTQFVGNKAQTSGGGVRAQGPLSVTGGVFEGNSAGNQGGGLYAYKSLALTSAKFIANMAVSGGGVYHYGGVLQNSESALLVNALFARNTAQSFGAAVYFDHPSTADVIHTTVASPTIASASAFFVGSGTIRITNTIVASHTTGFNRGIGTVFEDYTLFDAVPTPRGSGVLAGAHSFTGTTGFAAPAADNYRLSSASSALDAGVDAGVGTDFEGTTRPFGAGFDIGYDEWVPPRAYLPLLAR
ncbi:MAG TPA: choice-of-anchor Q domain-containing protein [Thermoflexales bacterium]|nr:choice-of-anchor Q domain-containing protein [Thermoflexales bacterium]HQY26113.1 choice-of-anchor Q domain-containing protein [Thermoflexales bacterium]